MKLWAIIFTAIAIAIPSYNGPVMAGNAHIALKINFYPTEEQTAFINEHFDWVMTSELNSLVREMIDGPGLLLYRSIQGTWTDFDQFDWDYIDSRENMFCHNTGQWNPHTDNRILTIWNSWLMDGEDLVPAEDPDALEHWVNYYAVTASDQVTAYGYDGLFIDSASHKLWPGAVYELLPDGYTDDAWRDGRYAALSFIKSYFPDHIVIFNGLHSRNGAEHSLSLTDGGLWEVFAFDSETGEYSGPDEWLEVIELARDHPESHIAITTKKSGLTGDIETRLFLTAGYFLVAGPNVYLTLIDLDYEDTDTFLYYPEYDLDLGEPLGDYSVTEDGLYIREFENGLVLVNPGETEEYSYRPEGRYNRVVPIGGGVVPSDGIFQGVLHLESAGDEITVPPIGGAILLKASPARPPSGDYDGDGTADIAVFRNDTGLWAVREVSRVYFGSSGDTPVPGDYDGDGTTDIGLYRDTTGLWALRGVSRAYFGVPGDTPVPADYDGNGTAEIGIFRDASGLWAIRDTSRAYFGFSGDTPIPADYNGDGSDDIGLFRDNSGLWALRDISRTYFGSSGDTPVPADFDGDRTDEIGIFRPAPGLWAVPGTTRVYFGSTGDIPVPADYDGDGTANIAVFRGATGLWAVSSMTRVYFGGSSDTPVTR